MIRTILVDDEPRGLNTLRKLLHEYCPELKVVAECTDAEGAKEKIELLEPQLVFLDISLAGKTGFDLLAELEAIQFEIIFVTAHNQYTLQAFRYSAVDYLMKPIDEDLLIGAVKRAIKRISVNAINDNIHTLLHNLHKPPAQQEMKLCIPSLQGFQVVELKDILFCEASGSYTGFYFTDEHHLVSAKPIHEYEELLSDAGFVRIHKSYLINLLHVKEYLRGEGGSVILSNDKEVEVSRRKKDIFLGKIKAFYKY
ncbi:response regulator [Paraflavitalea sp. CAU 1676]|uniref:LytR/AlgR family response regulator transcription factor n=1 Tax=Paraflavitalea sp. CAU 1676 TaxID=3032598 RepID=UPI0023DB9927|nr:response regulator [Paraflavitalea sp. CAU 1676]MDF2187913.1 response regulator [Paraflavitalea sp. CAU 1676]